MAADVFRGGGRCRGGVPSRVFLLDVGVALTVAEVRLEVELGPQMDDRLGMDLRNPRLRNVQRALDLLEGQPIEVVERDNGALLRRQLVDGFDERGLDLARFHGDRDVVVAVLERIDERNLVASFRWGETLRARAPTCRVRAA